MSFEALLKQGREFELRRESGSRFHSFGAETWNARDTIIVPYRGSANRRVGLPDDADNEEG